jgi:hypothetical protein
MAFEPTRLSEEYLHHAYECIAPVAQRSVCSEAVSLESQTEIERSKRIERKEKCR